MFGIFERLQLMDMESKVEDLIEKYIKLNQQDKVTIERLIAKGDYASCAVIASRKQNREKTISDLHKLLED